MEFLLGLDVSTTGVKAVLIPSTPPQTLPSTPPHTPHPTLPTPHTTTSQSYPSPPFTITNSNRATTDVCAIVRTMVQTLNTTLASLPPSSTLRGISIAAQQHAMVALTPDAPTLLASVSAHLDPSSPDWEDSCDHYIRSLVVDPMIPMWLDSSPEAVEAAQELEDAMGGKEALTVLTGSPGSPRFTGPQLGAFIARSPDQTLESSQAGHVRVLSSFLTSLLTGRLAPMDAGDGSGMNLLNIQTREWSEQAFHTLTRQTSIGPNQVLGPPPSHPEGGPLWSSPAADWVNAPHASVCLGTGDNPAVLSAFSSLSQAPILISLGTSDTLLALSSVSSTSSESFQHASCPYASLLCAPSPPYAPDAVMGMLCFPDGSQTRKSLTLSLLDDDDDDDDGGDGDDDDSDNDDDVWETFDAAIKEANPSNPVYAACLSRALEFKSMAPFIGVDWSESQTVAIVGGGSQSSSFCNLLASTLDVTILPIPSHLSPFTAAIGAALRLQT